MKNVEVPNGYQCPLCPDHKDDIFVNSKVVGKPICEGCSIEISHFAEEDERPDDFVLDRLEKLTNLSFHEYKKLAFEENIEEFEWRLQPENIDSEARFEMEITKKSFDEVVSHWKEIIVHYKNEIEKLNKIG
jgi:hypothetical protein